MSKRKGSDGDSDGSGSESDEAEADNWVQCDSCNKWRRIPVSAAALLDDKDPW